MAEDLAEFLSKKYKSKISACWNWRIRTHELIRQLRLGEFDVLIGINLLREGLDIPEVSLVVILDSDKEGFLRNDTSLIQTFGRAARHSDGMVIMYADRITKSMKETLKKQIEEEKNKIEFNKLHKILPISISKPITKDKNSEIQYEFLNQWAKTIWEALCRNWSINEKLCRRTWIWESNTIERKLKKINKKLE